MVENDTVLDIVFSLREDIAKLNDELDNLVNSSKEVTLSSDRLFKAFYDALDEYSEKTGK